MPLSREGQRQRRLRLIAEGRCPRCGDSLPPENRHKHCASCRKYIRDRHRTARRQRSEAGLCYECGARLPDGWTKLRCFDCLRKHNAQAKKPQR